MIIPFPVRVVVMVTLLEPVSILPEDILTVPAEILFNSVKVVVATNLFNVSILNVVVPVIEALLTPVN